ncbi:MAG TPA: glycosyltransferase family 4 protein [Myxococcales bacterium]
MRVAYVNYGNQSGVTPNVTRALAALGHELVRVDPTPLLALRDPRTRLPRPTPRVLLSLAASAIRHGPQLMHHRWNTVYAFDQHSRRAGELLGALDPRPEVVLQNGALFAPGRPPRFPYVLLLDNTCRLAERQPPVPEADIGAHISFGKAWLARERETYHRALGIATFSALVRDSLVDDYGVDPALVHVVGAGANVVPQGEPVRGDDGQTLLFVGKDGWRRKGGPVLLEAFSILRAMRPSLRLLLAGPTEELELPEGVTNLGLVPFESVERLLSEATLFVLPTLREPFGIAFLDAMLCKVPCIGTQVGAVAEILGGAGICVPPANAAALAQAMAELLDDPARRAAMGEAGRRRVLERGYLWPEVGKRLSAVLAGAGSRSRAA